jgi:hypothetical protein
MLRLDTEAYQPRFTVRPTTKAFKVRVSGRGYGFVPDARRLFLGGSVRFGLEIRDSLDSLGVAPLLSRAKTRHSSCHCAQSSLRQ